MKKCSKCNEPATMFRFETNSCAIHYRIKQMRSSAKRHGKLVPSEQWLEDMVSKLVADSMACPICRRTMNWLLCQGHSTAVTLQHDRNGEMRLMCFGCNSKHKHHPGDSYYELPPDKKHCSVCNEVKDVSEFYTHRDKPASGCKACNRAKSLAGYHANPEKRKERHRAWTTANRQKASAYERERRARKRGVA